MAAKKTKKQQVARRRPAKKVARSRSPRVTIVTLGVEDLPRSRAFYRDGLGFRVSSSSNEHIVFLDAGGIVLALYDRKALAEDAKVPPGGEGFRGVTLARNLPSKAAVDAALATAKEAGAKILKPAQEAFWGGYSGYFADPDGHLWEIAYNPHWKLDASGSVRLPG